MTLDRGRPAAALALIAALVCGCSSSGSSSPSSTSTSTSRPPALPTVGQSMKLRGEHGQEQVTMLATWRRGATYAVRFRIQTISGQVSDAPWISAAVLDAAGQEYEPAAIAPLAAGQELPGTVDPPLGDAIVGWVPFTVPAGVRVTRVKWTAGAVGDAGWWRA